MLFALLGVLFFVHSSWSGTTGKIAGIVTDNTTGEPLPGANIVVDGTLLGAVTNLDGQYTILLVPPGTYNIHVSYIGYTRVEISEVRVNIDLTARLDIKLEAEVIETKETIIVAERKVIKPDVASSVVAVTTEEVAALPVSSVQSMVGLQAGIKDGLQIRGGGADEALVLMDGVTLRDPRNNLPVSNVPLSAVKEINIERGGFNAEYGQVRSGLVNMVMQEGSRTNYYGRVELKYSPPHAKYFDISPFDQNSFWLRPYYDPAVCWSGTMNESYDDLNANGKYDTGESFTDRNRDGLWTQSPWDQYTQRQYPDFDGWNAISYSLLTDSDPNNDLTPLGAQRVFEWETRKEPRYNQPDYNVDAGFGGPIPVIGEKLGNLRFFTAYRRYREMLVVPLTRDDYVDYDWTIKLTSEITPAMKLLVSGIIGKQYTMQQNWSYAYLRNPETIASIMEDRPGLLFGTGNFSLADISHRNFSAKFTHTLNQNTYYEVSLEHMWTGYFTRPSQQRDKTKRYEIVPGYFVDEAPFGYDWANDVGITGMLFGGFTCKRRDNTKASATTFKADFSSLVNFSNLVKAGAEFVYNDLNFDYGIIKSQTRDVYDERVLLHVFPIRGVIYLQDKLETKGFIMNAGLRLDYSNSQTDWWNVDPYDKSFFTSKYNSNAAYAKTESKAQWQLSPRLGISHPVTENSKLFFNYGHYKQMPSYQTLFQVARSNDQTMKQFGDPSLILAKTISYELGYDHSLFENYLFQVAAFYHDITNQQDSVVVRSIGGIVYNQTTSNSYEDIRGFEISLRKNRGRWWTFFGNYTYQVSTSGHFGRDEIYQDQVEQKRYDEETTNLYQNRPIPTPYARINVSLFTPDDYGPSFSGLYPLGGFMMNFLLNWQDGPWRTYNPKNIAGLENNIQETDYVISLMRLSKTFNVGKFQLMAFMDVNNLFNYRRMSLSNFTGKAGDQEYYFSSLHLPKSEDYDNIPGDDRVGAYRKPGVDYQPMFPRGVIDFSADKGDAGVIYYDKSRKNYYEYTDNPNLPNYERWQAVDKGRIDRINANKAYIDMPDYSSFSFFNPRQFYFGLRISMQLD